MNKPVIIDNYDSFTYNLVYQVEEVTGERPVVLRNDQVDYDILDNCSHIILSPGPGLPEEAADLLNIIDRYKESKPILGVCLGHQAIVESFGGSLRNLDVVHHGVSTQVQVIDLSEKLFSGLTDLFNVGRYHSWVADNEQMPDILNISCVDKEGEIMAIAHKTLPIKGVQFHPESILTENGTRIIKNFLKL